MLNLIDDIKDTTVIPFPGITVAELTLLISQNAIRKVILLFIGTNDVSNNTRPMTIFMDLQHLLQAIRFRNVHIVLTTILPPPTRS